MRLAENWEEKVLSTVTNRFYECDISLTRQALLPGFQLLAECCFRVGAKEIDAVHNK